MPRIKQKEDTYAAEDFVREINAQCARFGYKTQRDLGDVIGVCQATAGNYLKNPDNIPMGKLRKMAKGLKLDPVAVLRALGYTTKDIKRIPEML